MSTSANRKNKILVSILIFILTFAHFAVVGKYSTVYAMNLLKSSESTGEDNVSFYAYFMLYQKQKEEQENQIATENAEKVEQENQVVTSNEKNAQEMQTAKANTEETQTIEASAEEESEEKKVDERTVLQEKVTEVESDINQNELEMVLDLNVYEAGYLKDTKITLSAPNDSFQYQKEKIQNHEMVQEVEENEIILKQMNYETGASLTIPIEYLSPKQIKVEDLNPKIQVKLTGTYVSNKGKEKQIEKEVTLTIAWKNQTEVVLENQMTQYVPFAVAEKKGVLIQNEVKLQINAGEKYLPGKSSKIEVTVPTIESFKPESVHVIAQSTEGTIGKDNTEIGFNQENWTYLENENQLVIQLENKINSENKIHSSSGVDAYTISYLYGQDCYDALQQKEIQISNVVKAEVKRYVGGGEETIQRENANTFTMQPHGDVLKANITAENQTISKGNIYANYHQEVPTFETELNINQTISVFYPNIIKGMMISDVQNAFLDSSNLEYATNEIYYKETKITKDEFLSILGEEGKIEIQKPTGESIASITKDSETNQEGKFFITYPEGINQIKIITSTPMNNGNIQIEHTKILKKPVYDKATVMNFASVVMSYQLSSQYEGFEDFQVVSNEQVKMNFEETKTNATINLSTDSLATLSKNENLELKVALNNQNNTSDLYSNPVFEIVFPKQVTNVEVVNSNIIYAAGLEIQSVETYEKNGNIRIRIQVSGTQYQYSDGVLSNGTNIILNLNVEMNPFTPLKKDEIFMKYFNESATDYEEGSTWDFEFTSNQNIARVSMGVSGFEIEYGAPKGHIAAQSIYLHESQKEIYSVNQGRVEEKIELQSPAKTATMNLVVMNNNTAECKHPYILGRFPREGTNRLTANNSLENTLDVTLNSLLIQDSNNAVTSKIYYSANKYADANLDKAENGWSENAEILEEINSYLIIPQKESMLPGEILQYSYGFTVPENLGYNHFINGTFALYYQNGVDSQEYSMSEADPVVLTTGIRPDLNLSLSADVEGEIADSQEFNYYLAVENMGRFVTEEVVMKIELPTEIVYKGISLPTEIQATVQYDETSREVMIQMPQLAAKERVEAKINVVAQALEEGETKEIYAVGSVTAKGLDGDISVQGNALTIYKGNFQIREFVHTSYTADNNVFQVEQKIKFNISVKNMTAEKKENVVIKKIIPEEFELVAAYKRIGINYENSEYDKNGVTYDESSKTILYDVGTLEKESEIWVEYEVKIKYWTDMELLKTLSLSSEVSAKDSKTQKSNVLEFKIGKPYVQITQSTNTNKYVKEGDTVEYIFQIENLGPVIAPNVIFTDYVGEGITVENITFQCEEVTYQKKVYKGKKATFATNMELQSKGYIVVTGTVDELTSAQAKEVKNYATINLNDYYETSSNEVSHVVQPDANKDYTIQNRPGQENNANTSYQSSNLAIAGMVWVDSNANGQRESDESKVSGTKVRLVNANNNAVLKSTTTNENGEYEFAGLLSGKYIVAFEYDSNQYAVTEYHRSDVSESVNSDVVSNKTVNQELAAVTDVLTLSNESISNIDMGLVTKGKFDLRLEKVITNITVTTKKETKSTEYNDTKLAKTEIAAKQMNGAVVDITYKIKIKNEGDVAGTASKIVDNIANDLAFDKTKNPNWYLESDGKLYTTELAKTSIQPGAEEEVYLILTKTMNEENTGLVNNTAEIEEDYNSLGLKDVDSTPGNGSQKEDDMGLADALISVKTGGIVIGFGILLIIGCLTAAIFYLKKHQRFFFKGGVLK